MGKFSIRSGITTRSSLACIILISNVFIWYSLAFSALKGQINEMPLRILSVHFFSAMFSAVVGATLAEKIQRKSTFLAVWMILGVISSLFLMCVNPTNFIDVLIISLLFGVSFGLGLPTSMAYFASNTPLENRGKFGGLIVFVNGLGTFLFGMIAINNTVLLALILAIWRGCGLILFLMINPFQEVAEKRNKTSFISILSQRSFMFYLIPWIMFSLVNYLSTPVQLNILGSGLFYLVSIASTLIAIFAIIAGFLSDFIGRKRVTVTGFIILGLGYAILGIYPESLLGWYFYTLADSIAWGIFFVIFIFTIWGDLSYGISKDKYYAIGGLPFYASNFLRLTIGSYIAEAVSPQAIFSFTAFFLFLAVFPLMYAPETLPEKKIRERELKKYIEKAKKIKEKYVKE